MSATVASAPVADMGQRFHNLLGSGGPALPTVIPSTPSGLVAPTSLGPLTTTVAPLVALGGTGNTAASVRSKPGGASRFWKPHWGKILGVTLILFVITILVVRYVLMKRNKAKLAALEARVDDDDAEVDSYLEDESQKAPPPKDGNKATPAGTGTRLELPHPATQLPPHPGLPSRPQHHHPHQHQGAGGNGNVAGAGAGVESRVHSHPHSHSRPPPMAPVPNGQTHGHHQHQHPQHHHTNPTPVAAVPQHVHHVHHQHTHAPPAPPSQPRPPPPVGMHTASAPAAGGGGGASRMQTQGASPQPVFPMHGMTMERDKAARQYPDERDIPLPPADVRTADGGRASDIPPTPIAPSPPTSMPAAVPAQGDADPNFTPL